MKFQNIGANALNVHDQLAPDHEDQYQPGIKSVTVPAAGTQIVSNANGGESKTLGSLLNSGRAVLVDGFEDVESVNVTYDTGGTPTTVAKNVPAAPGVVVGGGRVVVAKFFRALAIGTYRILLTPLTANSNNPDEVILGHISPNDEGTTVPVDSIVTGSAAAVANVAITLNWTPASGPTAGDADMVVDVVVSTAPTSFGLILIA
jgi:hypothetical protein